jgi:catechol 2,3-dioxygenase-like lactoylglutathione lyase family enzyme
VSEGVSHAYVWVEDHDRAISFYTEKLGFELCEDVRMGDRRWVTVRHPLRPDLKLALSEISSLDTQSVESIRQLQEKGLLNAGGLATRDCRGEYLELAGRGVSFVLEPTARPFGIEAVLRDDSGNLWGLVQPAGQ